MQKHSDNTAKWILIGAGALAVTAIVAAVMLRKPVTEGKTEAASAESVTVEATGLITNGESVTEAGSQAENGNVSVGNGSSSTGSPAASQKESGAAAKATDTQEAAETLGSEIVAVVDIHEKAVKALARERASGGVPEVVPEVVMEDIVIEDVEDSGDSGRSGTKEQQKSGQKATEPESIAATGEAETKQSASEPESTKASEEAATKQSEQNVTEPESTAASAEETKQDGQKEPETEETSPVESSEAAQETEGSTESTETETETEAETETTTEPVIPKKVLVLGSESITVPADAPESIQEFNELPGESKYDLAVSFDSVAAYNKYLQLLQKAADQARIEAGGEAVID